jgi:anti-sigma regulatory factor (Ser/Thr protein kinase)
VTDHLADRLLTRAFDRGQVSALRREVAQEADRVGLEEARRQDFTLAVDEILTNAVRHGGGTGRLELWIDDGTLWFQVSDAGAGFAPDWPLGPPSPTQIGGRGLWIAREMTDSLTINSGLTGTVVRGGMSLPESGVH